MKSHKYPDSLYSFPETNRDYKRMLLIEDDPACILLIEEIFSEAGIGVVSETKGLDGLKYLMIHPTIDIILLDMRLPDINGFSVFQGIKKINPSLPVIAITAYVTPEMQALCKQAGFFGFMAKPFRIHNLIKMIDIVMSYKSN